MCHIEDKGVTITTKGYPGANYKFTKSLENLIRQQITNWINWTVKKDYRIVRQEYRLASWERNDKIKTSGMEEGTLSNHQSQPKHWQPES